MYQFTRRKPHSPRSPVGQHVLEFGGALFILVVCIIFPLVDLAIIPIRFAMSCNILAGKVHNFAVSERFSDALNSVDQAIDGRDALIRISGIHVKSTSLALCIQSSTAEDATIKITRAGEIPADWLPNGAKAPCDYFLTLNAEIDIDPLVTVPIFGRKITGINGPVSFNIGQTAHWGNLGCDPSTGSFFINE